MANEWNSLVNRSFDCTGGFPARMSLSEELTWSAREQRLRHLATFDNEPSPEFLRGLEADL